MARKIRTEGEGEQGESETKEEGGGGVELTIFIGAGCFDGGLKKSQIHEGERVIENK